MPRIRLLTSIAGDGVVVGDPGDVLEVDESTARLWCDDVRAEAVEPVASRRVARPRGEQAVRHPGGEQAVRGP